MLNLCNFYTSGTNFSLWTMKNLIILLFLPTTIFASVDFSFIQQDNYGTDTDHELQLQSPLSPSLANSFAHYKFTLDWIEPFLGNNNQQINAADTYLRSLNFFAISPYYAQFSSGIGISPVPFFEFSVHYSHFSYLGSTAHMQKNQLDKQWTPEWLNNHSNSMNGYEFIQRVHLRYALHYFTDVFSIESVIDHQLIDIKSDHREYFYDYANRLPLFGRDDIFKLRHSLSYKLYDELEPFVQSLFTLNNFKGKFNRILDHESKEGKPVLYRHDLYLGVNHYPSLSSQKRFRCSSWLEISDTSKGKRFSITHNIAIGAGFFYSFNFSEYKDPNGSNHNYQ